MSSFFTASSYVGLVDSRSHTRSSSYDRVSLYPTITTVMHDDEISASTSNFTLPSSLNPSTYTGASRLLTPMSLVVSPIIKAMDHWPWMPELRDIFLSLICEEIFKNGSNII